MQQDSLLKLVCDVIYDKDLIKDDWIDKWVDNYRSRLHECIDNGGEDTRY
jgi:hypothetical protein